MNDFEFEDIINWQKINKIKFNKTYKHYYFIIRKPKKNIRKLVNRFNNIGNIFLFKGKNKDYTEEEFFICTSNNKLSKKLTEKYLILDFTKIEDLNNILKDKYTEIYTAIPKKSGKIVWKNIGFKYLKNFNNR